jgi:hypothetical protein
MVRPFLYQCPVTRLTVQGTVEGEAADDAAERQYEGVECTACGRLHLVNVTTLRLRSEEDE